MDQPTVVLLHGWPGLPSDYDDVVTRLPHVRCVVPALAGFGAGFDGPLLLGEASADRHAARLLSTLPTSSPLVVVGYDIGSRIAQAMLRQAPDRFAGAVLTPGTPGSAHARVRPSSRIGSGTSTSIGPGWLPV